MFKIDSEVRQEAVNFSTLMNVLHITEHRLEPQFDNFSKTTDITVPLIDEINSYADYFNVNVDSLQKEYNFVLKEFLKLKESDEIIKRGSYMYPELLERTSEAPRFLYVRGDTSLLNDQNTIAIIGSRNASENAKRNTEIITRVLSRNGLTIVSGLAKGIDVTAHKTALDNKYRTIAVIGTHLNQYYPSENKNVQLEIEKKDLVISQFSPSTKTERYFFPLRNGVMSGMSLATVIMEAGENSGSLKQADYALKQDRQVFIPQNIVDQNKYLWVSKYINRGAEVIKTPIDTIHHLSNNIILKEKSNNYKVYSATEKEEIKAMFCGENICLEI